MTTNSTRATQKELEDAFIKVTFEEGGTCEDRLYTDWIESGSAPRSDPLIFGVDALRKLYPGYSILTTQSDILGFPDALVQPIAPDNLVTTTMFIPLARRSGIAGALVDLVSYGAFRVAWNEYDFIVYVGRYTAGLGLYSMEFVVHDGPEEHSRSLLFAAETSQFALHNQIWVFNQGFWHKDAGLFDEIEKASWDDIILNEQFKTDIQKDIYGFFTSEAIYKELAIPWKRGLLLYGPSGNGKTITVKAIMKSCIDKGYAPLYVKSFNSFMGDEASMDIVFEKTRNESPCVLVLEDLDSLITEQNRSFFLNQLDGLTNNDGLLLIGTTNHMEKLDPGLSTRPSRFDRKYLFDNPTREDRTLYVEYWQNKLKKNKDVSFPDSLKTRIADATGSFSFAYLKEAFVSSLVLLAGFESDKRPAFEIVIMGQIQKLRNELEHQPAFSVAEPQLPRRSPSGGRPQPHSKSDDLKISAAEASRGVKIYRAGPGIPLKAESKDVDSFPKGLRLLRSHKFIV